MGTPTVGDVIIVAYPYADFRMFKKRPALVVAEAEHSCIIIAQITSKKHASSRAIALLESDFANGGLQVESYVRVDKLVTIETSSALKIVGALRSKKAKIIINRVADVFDAQ